MTYGRQSPTAQRQVAGLHRPPRKGVKRMAIYQRGTSYYYDFVYKGQRYTGCIGPVSRTVAKPVSRTVAKEEEARKKAEVIEGRLNPAKARKTPRFDAFADEYLDWVKANRAPGTARKAA